MKRRIGFAIAARCGSTRLPRKHFLEVNGRPLLWYLLQRVRDSADGGPVIIATTIEPENESFRSFEGNGVSCFAGAIRNIPLRFLDAARSAALDGIVAIDGDDILCSTAAMAAVRTALVEGGDYVTTRGLPLGMNAAGFSTRFLADAAPQTAAVLETGWHRIFDSSRLETIDFGAQADARLRLTLDYEADFLFFERLLSLLGDESTTVSDTALIDVITRECLFDINSSVNETYWRDFEKQVHQEQRGHERNSLS
jgi:spore coat polysaccharide biosynthesis protein SpsF